MLMLIWNDYYIYFQINIKLYYFLVTNILYMIIIKLIIVTLFYMYFQPFKTERDKMGHIIGGETPYRNIPHRKFIKEKVLFYEIE